MPLNGKIKRFINDSRFGTCAEKLINGLSALAPTENLAQALHVWRIPQHGIKYKHDGKITHYRHRHGKSNAHIIRKNKLQQLRKINTQNTHTENRLGQITRAERKIVQSMWMEKMYLTHGKTLSIYHHRNNCGGIVYGKIVGCPRKNICIVVVNESATEKLELVKLR